MEYCVAFSKLTEPELRRMLMGDGEHEPLTAVTYVRPWVWNGVCEIARRNGESLRIVLRRAVRHYVIAEGFNAPHYVASGAGVVSAAGNPPSRPGMMARIAGYFKRIAGHFKR